MSTGAAAGSRDTEVGAYHYQRHQTENTLLYQIVERYYPEFTAYFAEQGAVLPQYVQREFEAYLNPHFSPGSREQAKDGAHRSHQMGEPSLDL